MAKNRHKTRNRNNFQKESAEPEKKAKPMAKIVAVITVVALAAILGGLYHYGYLIPGGQGSGGQTAYALPASINTGEFASVSNYDYASSNTVNIYFLSWQGCPIGAADSWFIYNTLSSYNPNVNAHIQNHTSDPHETYPNTPGLLFTNFSVSHNGITYNFKVIYVYGETLPTNENLITAGLSTLKSNVPSNVYTLFKDYQTDVPVSGSSKAISAQGGHLTSSILITGKGGTYYLEGPKYNPSTLSGYSPQYVYDHLGSFPPISSSSSYFQTALNTVSS